MYPWAWACLVKRRVTDTAKLRAAVYPVALAPPAYRANIKRLDVRYSALKLQGKATDTLLSTAPTADSVLPTLMAK